jgi:16S rRNA C967 or C1407 C5-methylase (RsmB/RsmF family)
LETLQSAASELKHDLDLVYAKYKEQSLQMNTLKAEADDLRQKLAAAVKSKNGAEVATFTTLVETLRGQLETSVKAEAAAREGLARYQNEAASLKKQVGIDATSDEWMDGPGQCYTDQFWTRFSD